MFESKSTASEIRRKRVAIIGRPNVGKSTLFNILTGTRKAVVKNEPGVTRDIQIEPVEWDGHIFDVVDTGGITEGEDPFADLIRRQVMSILGEVDMILMVADGRVGICPEDRDVFKLVVSAKKPFILCANKTDNEELRLSALSEFSEFGVDVLMTAFEQRRGITEILDWIGQFLPNERNFERRNGVYLAILGKPNVGKSSLCNRLLGEERMIVSDIAGTTVDAIDSGFTRNGKLYVITDTAGLRRKSKRRDGVEVLSSFKSRDALERADVVLLVVDGLSGPSDQDSKIIQMCFENHKSVILVVNKLDLALEEIPAFRSSFREKVRQEMHYFEDIHICFVSAKTGAGLQDLCEKIDEIWNKVNIRIKTSDLNDFFFKVIRQAPAPVCGSDDVKFYYLTQTQQLPPSFIAFVNHPDGVDNSYRRFLSKKIKERWDLQGIPIRIFAMKSRGAHDAQRF